MASLFLIVGTVWADAPVVGQRYRLKNAMTGLYMQVNATNPSSNLQLQEKKFNVAQVFCIEVAEGGKFYLKSESGANKYVNASGWNAVVSDNATTPFTIALVEGETDLYTLDQQVSGYKGKIGADESTAGSSLYCNKGVGNNGKWRFEPVVNPEAWTFDPAKIYRIRSQYSGLYMQVMNYTTSGITEGAFKLKGKDILAEGQKFMFEAATDGKFYLKTLKGTDTYYVNMDTWNFHAGTDPTTPFTIEEIEGFPGVYSIHQAVGANTGHHGYAGNVGTGLTDGANIYCNQPSLNGNTVWSFEEVPAVDPNNITELTQFDNNSYYKIAGERGFIFGADGVLKGTNVVSQAYNECDLNQHFAIISKNGKYYLYNVGAKKFVVKSGNNTKLVDLPEQPITLDKTGNNNYVWSIMLNGTNKINLSQGYNDYGIYTEYNDDDEGNRWYIYKTGTFDPTEALAAFDKVYVTVNYVHNGKTFTKTEVATKGSTFTFKNPSTYTTVTSCTVGGNTLTENAGVYSITVPNEGTTVTMNLEGQLPFAVSESYANAVWQFMRIRPVRNGNEEFNWVTKGDAAPYTFSSTRPTTDAGLWAFVGNVVDGFKIYNKAADDNSTLGVDGSNVVVKEGQKTWTVGKCIEGGSNLRGFYLYEGTDNKYAHEYGGKLQIWDNANARTDGGSAFVACNPLIVNYVGAEGLDDLDIEALVEGGVYTLANRSEHVSKFLFIKSVTVNGNVVEAVNGVWPITLNGVTEVEVTLDVPELANKPTYALKSPTGTYLGMVGAATGLVANGVYNIRGGEDGIKRGYLVAGTGYTTGDKAYPVLDDITYSGCDGNSVDAIENGKNWYIYTNANGTYIYNLGLGQFLVSGGSTIYFAGDPFAWKVIENGNYKSIYTDANKYLSMGCGRTAAQRPVQFNDSATDGGSLHTFTAVSGDFSAQIAVAQAAIDAIAVSFQETPLYLTYAPAVNRGAIFQYKDDATKYIGYTPSSWNVTTNESTWTILEADLAGYSQIVRSDDDTKYLGSNANTNVGTSLYSDVDDACNKWTFEGAYESYEATTTKKDNNKNHFSSDLLFYAGECNILRFTLTEASAYYNNDNNKLRLSFDSFELYDINGNKVELTEACFSGNNSGKIFANMLDGVNNTYCAGTWASGTESDWFEITLPNSVDLGGAFSFSFVTESGDHFASPTFRIGMRCEKTYYRLNIDAPYGYEYEATYGGEAVVNGHSFEGDFDVTQFTISDIEGYAYTVEVDDENYIVNVVYTQVDAIVNPAAVVALINRIGGIGTANSFKFVLDNEREGETFVIGAEDSKILIKGSTISAITTGIGWYLNNIAHINIAWNSLNEKTTTVKWDANAGYADLSHLPLPSETETHTSDAKYRYYLNTCTFGYSMTSWTWTRWQQEIDWMALHGINMPLQLVGLEEVWRTFLIKCGYSETDAKAFVAGPAFIAWWAMNNLQGWGGTAEGSKSGYNNLAGAGGVQDDAWYARQKKLAKQILDAQRALGMQPVLPGWSGMVPTNFNAKTGYTTRSNGQNWAGDFVRPLLLNVNNANYAEIAADYYECLEAVMGESQYYSMDPFHEGGGTGTTADYQALYAAMEAAQPGSQWVIQQWQWNAGQKLSINAVPAGKLIVLDLFSDGSPAFASYNGYAPQDAVFCAIPNFGGRSGLMGRLQNVTDNYFKFKGQYESIKGIGTAPEAIEQTPVTYDLIYQLPWMNGQKPNVAEWVDNYAIARYGKDNAVVKEAWSLLRQGPLNYGADGIQGPVEDVWAARPNLDANKASSWGQTLANAGGTYTPARRQMLIDAVYKLIDQEDELALTNGSVYKSNYLYDLVEFGGAVMADYAYDLLLGIKAAKNAAGDGFATNATYIARRDAFLQLILDMDAFRGTNLNFRLGKWTQEARDAAAEVTGATTATPDWYEYNNARTILTTWSSPGTDLTDYSYRSWQGLLKDYYYKRWKYYFDNNCTGAEYKYFEWNWAHGKEHYVGQTDFSNVDLTADQDGHTSKYTREPVGNTVEEAVKMLGKYIIPVAMADGTHYAYRYLTNDLSSKVTIIVAGNTIDLTQYFGTLEGATVTGTFINGGSSTNLAEIPLNANLDGAYTGTLTLADGTVLTFGVTANPKYYGAYKIKYSGDPVFIQYHTVLDNGKNIGYKVVTTKKANGSSTGYSADYEADKIFTITPSGTGFALSAQGQYLKTTVTGTNWHHIMFSENKGDAGTYTISEPDVNGLVKLKSTNSGMASVAIFDNGAWGNDEDGKAISFSLEQVTTYAINIPESGYYGICLPFNVVLPTGVTAYDVTVENLTCGEDGAITSLAEIATEGQTLKAGTPALLKGTAGNYDLAITMDNTNAKTSTAETKLRGNFVKQTLAPGTLNKFIYTSEGKHPFIRVNGEQEIPANTCWIEANIDADNVEVTEHQGKVVKVDDWLFSYQDATNGIKLIDAVVPGDGDLEISENFVINGKAQKVVAISPDFLHDRTDLTSVTFPSSLTNLGFREVEPMFETSYEGKPNDGVVDDTEVNPVTGKIEKQGMHSCLVFPKDPSTGKPYVVSKDFAWKLTLDVTIDSPEINFNNFGSAIVSTYKNSLDDYYHGYMQIYMQKGHKNIVVKIDNADDRYKYNTKVLDGEGNETAEDLVLDSFKFELEHDGAGGYQVVIYYPNGKAKMYNISASENNKVGDFDRLYYSLPEGIHVKVKFEKLISQGLFVGCTNLKTIKVHENNPTFKSCEHGVLYDKNGYYVMRIPEGGTDHYDIPSKVVKLYAGSIHGVKADVVLHSNPEIGVVQGHENDVKNVKFYLSLDDIDNTITENETGYGGARDFTSTNNNTYKGARYKRAPLAEGVYGTIMLPFAPDNALTKYDFFKFIGGDANSLTFSQVDKLEAQTPYLYKLKEGFEDDATEDIFETGEEFTVQTLAKYDPNDEEPGKARALGAYVNYYIETENYKNSSYYYYKTSAQAFYKVTKKLTYRPYRVIFVVTPEQQGQAAQAPARLSLRLLDGTTTDIDASLVEGMEAPEYYDLSGRRVLNPGSGVYIVNGKKVLIK